MYEKKSRYTFPCVTLEQMLAFDPDRPETWTPSPLVNAVMDATHHVRPVNNKTVARYIGLAERELACGMNAMAGITLREYMEAWRKAQFHRLLQEQPDISSKDMARQMQFSSQGALWTFLTRNKLIEPLRWHYGLVQHMAVRREAEQQLYDDEETEMKEEVRSEMRRRKWEAMTRKSKK